MMVNNNATELNKYQALTAAQVRANEHKVTEPVTTAKDTQVAAGNVENDSAKSGSAVASKDRVEYSDETATIKKIVDDTVDKETQAKATEVSELIRDMVKTQSDNARYASNANDITAKFNIDNVSQAQAAYNVSDRGGYSRQMVTNKIVDTALAVANEDVKKLEVMREAVNKGFRDAELKMDERGNVSGLPQVSIDTYNEVKDRLEYAEKNDASLNGYEKVAEAKVQEAKVEEKVVEEKVVEEKVVDNKSTEKIEVKKEEVVDAQSYNTAEAAAESDKVALAVATEVVASNTTE